MGSKEGLTGEKSKLPGRAISGLSKATRPHGGKSK